MEQPHEAVSQESPTQEELAKKEFSKMDPRDLANFPLKSLEALDDHELRLLLARKKLEGVLQEIGVKAKRVALELTINKRVEDEAKLKGRLKRAKAQRDQLETVVECLRELGGVVAEGKDEKSVSQESSLRGLLMALESGAMNRQQTHAVFLALDEGQARKLEDMTPSQGVA